MGRYHFTTTTHNDYGRLAQGSRVSPTEAPRWPSVRLTQIQGADSIFFWRGLHFDWARPRSIGLKVTTAAVPALRGSFIREAGWLRNTAFGLSLWVQVVANLRGGESERKLSSADD